MMRQRTIYISDTHNEALRVAALLSGDPQACADSELEKVVTAWLESRPELGQYIKTRDRLRAAADGRRPGRPSGALRAGPWSAARRAALDRGR